MPFARKGRVIYKKVGGRWIQKQRCGSIAKAKSALRILKQWESEHSE